MLLLRDNNFALILKVYFFSTTKTVLHFAFNIFRLEQDEESPEKSPTFAMDENIRILEDMRAYFESFSDDVLTEPPGGQGDTSQ